MERDQGKKPHWEIIRDAAVEVGPTLFYSLLVITVSFIPVFTLQAQEGRLFKPLAFTRPIRWVRRRCSRSRSRQFSWASSFAAKFRRRKESHQPLAHLALSPGN